MAQPQAEERCICGKCFEGWLSPRMRERLEYSTELRYELSKSLLETQDGVPDDITSVLPIDYAHIDVSVHYLPAEVRAKIGPSAPSEDCPAGDTVYRGYIAVFKAIKDLIAGEDPEHHGFPSVSTVSDHLSKLRDRDASEDLSSKYIAAYLDNGGKAEYALDCIVDRAREELSPLGRQYNAENQYIDAVLESEQSHAACANDLDFALVREKLGLPAETRGVVPDDEADSRDPPSDDEQ
ncbi:hypothetical protein L226DRAFT_468856 [Lentinus tigrinus ALCF2SS1-7]|uniref:Uncharacterized protein n=1 Tax=Lentinus tigrinus ALCF2SS1-6 TaxID=1328759 RepID=A0A5C2RX53_9APHY|nr:hypothetical protein L227DRAFT_657009 [Lentinus tigrinus ALCF2SS1-6]RPD71350.1 hypothetical protein L226DRAFT_468856 [Lentinus tigrinus ALCF2SS1-7]